ncbi:MAG: hypothetical protein A3J58_02125 [Candidatus Sungbacteria bacterium RIFCSPHIGHO2_02_FULL_52_23]|uniref:Uncharacterized protein n=1 Tax=Candidatus Sungbacteria bacterium RIFCSPHIGHO2_02_FULL_52_23 TaxID=1802274 RepID=A0A1G2KUZ7_9BACT|nr:MAG: hypothetical protein A3J58_02125 [Candidatus Sungbacteria bacterium RIFCSPHIGHO2_02_FULL_52_23]
MIVMYATVPRTNFAPNLYDDEEIPAVSPAARIPLIVKCDIKINAGHKFCNQNFFSHKKRD